jgi:magnesium-transporting ATPase (P-type)
MYAALLIIHCLLLRFFIEGLQRREFDLFGGEMSPATGVRCTPEEIDAGLCTGEFKAYLREWLGYVIVGVAVIVVAVPEGLPLAVMISLAYSVSKMLKDQNFVKKLSSCEIMGGANNICSDKTGTLTKNQMTWTNIWAGSDDPKYAGKLDDPDGTQPLNIAPYVKSPKTMELLAQSVSLNTAGTHLEAGATELAMLKFIKRCEVDYAALRTKYFSGVEMVRFPFDSARKRMSTLLELKSGEQSEHGYPKRLLTKGASEIILETCTHYLTPSGEKAVLDDVMSMRLKEIINSYAKQALRTIGFAYKDLKPNEGGPQHEEIAPGSKIYAIEEGGYTLVCIAGIKDIIRDEVPAAVALCNEAGVRVRMVTGDNLVTAIAIAKECGILAEGEE